MDIKLIHKQRPVVRKVFKFFYDYDFHRPVPKDASTEHIRNLIRELEKGDYEKQFDDAKNRYLKKDDSVCRQIIDTAFKLEKNK